MHMHREDADSRSLFDDRIMLIPVRVGFTVPLLCILLCSISFDVVLPLTLICSHWSESFLLFMFPALCLSLPGTPVVVVLVVKPSSLFPSINLSKRGLTTSASLTGIISGVITDSFPF